MEYDLLQIRVKTREYDLLQIRVGEKHPPGPRIRVGQKEPPRPGSRICYGYECARKSHQEPGGRFVTDKSGPEKATKTREYDLLRIRVGQKEPP